MSGIIEKYLKYCLLLNKKIILEQEDKFRQNL